MLRSLGLFDGKAKGECPMKHLNSCVITLAFAITLMGCESPGSNETNQNAHVKDGLAQRIYLNIMKRITNYEDLPANKKALTVCINWSGTDESYTDIRYSYANYESKFSERAISSSRLMGGAINGCEKAKKKNSLDCQCVPVDRNGSSVLPVPCPLSDGCRDGSPRLQHAGTLSTSTRT